ncbi:Rpp20 subunit of nuclear RNase MRP and P-domain-containing protein [Aspergillus pseudodeflectus]|uniref:Rpp20 subunit of nuclear RNase MRP and P-domain-containing protein n=1 Tax=Aspergillus pseudodeflectus TaxID=176178 RepID=A0ABR4KM18_9EURO
MPAAKRQKTSTSDTKTTMSPLNFERKNQDMVKLPKSAKVHKRPIPHPATASPYAGASVPKTVYISSSTPYMAAVKRVQKLLRQAEKRATAAVEASLRGNGQSRGRSGGGGGGVSTEKLVAALARGEGKEDLVREEVFVKATGRAIETALKVGKWFGKGEREAEYTVRVETGSVLVVDDVEEGGGTEKGGSAGGEVVQGGTGTTSSGANMAGPNSDGKTDETTMVPDTTTDVNDTTIMSEKRGNPTPPTTEAKSKPLSEHAEKKRKRAATLAAQFAGKELPESRTRWVNSVQVAISLK